MIDRCPHGDLTCPCQDFGDPCHYEGMRTVAGIDTPGDPGTAMVCPNPTSELTNYTGVLNSCNRYAAHCHVEGCGWTIVSATPCGLAKLGVTPGLSTTPSGGNMLDDLRGSPYWACGMARGFASSASFRHRVILEP